MEFASILLAWLMLTGPAAWGVESRELTVSLDGQLIDPAGLTYAEDGEIYIPLRETAEALGATVTWDGETETATVRRKDMELTARVGDRFIVANGRYLFISAGVRLREGEVMVTVSALAKAFSLEAEVQGGLSWLRLTTRGGAIESGDRFYGAEDLYWLSHIIEAEAGVEVLDGKIAVGNVVLNRCADKKEFPDTIKEVIFDNRFGIQFSPAYSGSINKEPGKWSIIAAKLCLDGANTGGESLYFCPTSRAKVSWAGQNRRVFAVIGSQTFFL